MVLNFTKLRTQQEAMLSSLRGRTKTYLSKWGYTQRQLAEAVKISETHLNDFLQAKRGLSETAFFNMEHVLSLNATQGALTFQVPLRSVSPAIFVDPEGTPLIMDAASGVLLDASKPAHASSRIQVLATGLGQVKPDWPTGLEAPLKDPPRVAATVHAYLDGSPVEVTQASLAPGYVGFYLIEIQIPRITNTGPSELYLDAEGQQSNRVRLYVEQ